MLVVVVPAGLPPRRASERAASATKKKRCLRCCAAHAAARAECYAATTWPTWSTLHAHTHTHTYTLTHTHRVYVRTCVCVLLGSERPPVTRMCGARERHGGAAQRSAVEQEQCVRSRAQPRSEVPADRHVNGVSMSSSSPSSSCPRGGRRGRGSVRTTPGRGPRPRLCPRSARPHPAPWCAFTPRYIPAASLHLALYSPSRDARSRAESSPPGRQASAYTAQSSPTHILHTNESLRRLDEGGLRVEAEREGTWL